MYVAHLDSFAGFPDWTLLASHQSISNWMLDPHGIVSQMSWATTFSNHENDENAIWFFFTSFPTWLKKCGESQGVGRSPTICQDDAATDDDAATRSASSDQGG